MGSGRFAMICCADYEQPQRLGALTRAGGRKRAPRTSNVLEDKLNRRQYTEDIIAPICPTRQLVY